jgi:hypothetical protein
MLMPAHVLMASLTAEACSFYKIITSDPSGNDQTDTGITVRARTFQIFLLLGGAHGRINKGEEVVALTFEKGWWIPTTSVILIEPITVRQITPRQVQTNCY